MADIIFRRIAAPRTLAAAWQRVRRNGGGAGLDGMDVEAFAADADRRLAGLSRSLFAGTYRPRALLKVEIAKPAGGVRRLAVPTLIDRIAQAAAAAVLDDLLDRGFSDASFAYRRGRSVGHALGRVLTYRLWGCRWAFDTDIADFFDTIPQTALLADLAARVASPMTVDLVRLWLSKAPRRGLGVPQGGPISPLLSNLYLDPVDRAIATRRVRLVRYADNIMLLATGRSAAREAGERLAALLAARGLALNPAKTRLIPLHDEFVFLGYRMGRTVHASSPPHPVARRRDSSAPAQ
jgi:CRISPR-associated protein Cas1